MDKGYDSDEVRRFLLRRGFTPHVRSRGEEIKEKKRSSRFKARRWVVERTGSWVNRNRGLLVRWCKKMENYDACLHFACAVICFNHLGLIG